MDKLEQQLQQDAEEIRPILAPEVSARLMARIKDTQQAGSRDERHGSGISWWLASSLTGVAAAAVVLAVMSLNSEMSPQQPAGEFVAQTVPKELAEFDNRLPLRLENVVMTTPLEEELQNLESDLEKAREAVRREFIDSI